MMKYKYFMVPPKYVPFKQSENLSRDMHVNDSLLRRVVHLSLHLY